MNYKVIKCRRKTLCLTIGREGDVIVRAPLTVKDGEIEAFVMRHASWIEKRLISRSADPKFKDGEMISLLGKDYTIAPALKRARIVGDTLFLPEEGREEALALLLRSMTRERMGRLLREISETYGFEYTSLTVTSARGRWGSCSTRKGISFSFRTAFLPDPLAEYLAVHELCHTRHMDHSAAFWREVGNILPDYAARRRALKGYDWAVRCL